MDGLPDRRELGPMVSRVEFSPVSLPRQAGPLRLAGAWKLTSEDPRFGGISALAVDHGNLLAITDSGAVVRFPKPHGSRVAAASVRELPDGPGDRRFKAARDSESLARDPAGRGWWVGFESRHSLWLFDRDLRRSLATVELGQRRWHHNRGIEALATDGRFLLAFPENGTNVLQFGPGSARQFPIVEPRGRISDAISIGGGKVAVVHRNPGLLGFKNSLGILKRSGTGYRYAAMLDLPVSALDNVEALAAETLPNGATRLWFMTDDNYHAPLRTLLFAYDLPAKRQPG